jgi:phenylacetate-CoA ligase
MARNFPESKHEQNQTGGSTGSPLQFYVDKDRFGSRLASTVRHNRWAGYQPGDWCAELWGARLDQVSKEGWWDWCRNAFLYRVVALNTSTIGTEDWNPFIAALRKKHVRFLVTYTQSAVLFARYLREKGIDDISFESLITTAEVLLPGQRELLEEVFRGRVFNRYGSREVSVIASECEEHRGMHVNAEALRVEIVPDPLLPAPNGSVVITDLLNFSMPLIRYEIGDVGRWAENQECPCGRGLPLLEDLQGRITDFLILPDGRKISGPSLTLVVSDMPDVRQVQFVQKSRDTVTLRVVRGNGYGPETAAEIQRRLSLYLQGVARMEIEEVESLPSMASGKYRFVVNEFQLQTVGASDALQGTRA